MKHKHKHLIYPIFLPMQGCAQLCIYCDQNKISGSDSFDLAASVKGAAEFVRNHPDTQKEIAFYGGTFTALDLEYRDELISSFKAIADEYTSFRISTHPAWIDDAILAWCAASGVRCIELGIQDFDDEVLNQSQRGYTATEAKQACLLVKQKGFELGIQLMPGLPGWNESSILANHAALEEIKPEYLRLYPLIVVIGTPLAEMYEKGQFEPLSTEMAIEQCAAYLEITHRLGIKVIKLGIPSNIRESDILAGPWHPAFGELVKAEILVRRLEHEHIPGEMIVLDRKSRALLMAHSAKYMKILHDRIENCTIMPIE